MLATLTLVVAAAPQGGAVALRQACLDAGTDAVVLNVAAHPDDEAARSLVYLRRTLGVRTVALFTTCGEGGQNAVGRDIGAALAKRRVLETLAAAAHTDTEVRWLGFDDFGYSKSLPETLKVWGETKLYDAMLAALHSIRPDVVLTNHDTVRGHGHHRASAWAIERAIVEYARASGRVVPLYQRPADEKDAASLTLEVGLLDPVAGRTFARQAHDGLLEHASQGPWGAHDPARVRGERWKLVWPKDGPKDGTGPADPFAKLPSAFDDADAVAAALGIDREGATALAGTLAGLRDDRAVAERLDTVGRAHAILRRGLDAAREPADSMLRTRLARRLHALERAWLHGHGVSVEAYAVRTRMPYFGRGVLRVAVLAQEQKRVADLVVTWQGLTGAPATEGPLGALVREIDFHLLPPGLRREQQNDPVTGARVLQPEVHLTIEGVPLKVEPRVRILPVPQVDMAWDRDVMVLPRAAKAVRRVLSLDVDYNGDSKPSDTLVVVAPPGVKSDMRPARLEVSHERRSARALVRVEVDDASALAPGAHLVARHGAHETVLPLRVVDVQVPADLKVGLVRGPDDTLLRTLQDLGIDYVELDERALAVAELADFTTLALDIRTGGNRPDLRDHRDRIHEFCAHGGRVVAFYHKTGEWNARPGRPTLAPYDLEIGEGRVSEEDAAVEFLQPDHALLARPHRITGADFTGWVQERGLNFPSKWADAWQPLLRMADTEEKTKPQDGSLLCAKHGQGEFVYCALALYRQWRVGHEGALRLLVNLLATPPRGGGR